MFQCPARIYNIDESWFSPKDARKQKIITDKNNNMPYKLFGGVQDHTTLTLCICADGSWVPPMLTIQRSIPATTEFLDQGPTNAFYTSSDTGHIDSEMYFRYIVHIEPYLNECRPVIIFQDNLAAHCTDELVEFCVSKNVHLYTFPPKTSHLLQPLDKLFGHFKTIFEQKKHEATLIQHSHVSRAKLPILTRFTMQSIKPETIRGVFEKTGIYPLARCKITADLLVGDISKPTNKTPTHTDTIRNIVDGLSLNLQVFDASGAEIRNRTETHQDMSIQTLPVATLSCSTCISNDVQLHPAVASGIVDLDLAAVFIPDHSGISNSTAATRKRNSYEGKCITSASEMERRNAIKEEKEKMEEIKKKRRDEREEKKREKQREIEDKKAAALAKKMSKDRRKIAEENGKVGRICRGSICGTCSRKVDHNDIVKCVICGTRFHSTCIRESSFITVCSLCESL